MSLNDEDLKRIFRAYVGGRDPGERRSCPTFDELSGFFEAGTRRKDKLKIVDHITACSACAEEFEFLRGLHGYENLITSEADRLRPPQETLQAPVGIKQVGHRLWRYAFLAAGALLMIGSLALLMTTNRLGEKRAPSSAVELFKPGQDQMVSVMSMFEWMPIREANAYVLEVFDEVLLPVWKSQELDKALLKPPEELQRRLRPGRPYFWMVTAFRNGDKLAESELRRFVFSGKAP